ncbi:uncharacterized protein sgo2 isoform X1 [Syngnathus typhle]|uniref:uncharacterized protein sgo2 isoform X1 n=1 Tax=Syngnathus typhle TaxID=161592 RepID=UPI002A69C66C|nr:uncharacterized protein sgo2 isoform X1 [Syngnathus typhle]XP_061143779.1 uncharacterized protein sgo2 isoform X1 [Syngnathus typhle]XP_061143780.1 uncharacterized protein sgo2 isoform X1 [Syngnathus typhle]XP_061143782.1 uncharacterized protein sgo2 isoform X1 [Syngnathus typhle]
MTKKQKPLLANVVHLSKTKKKLQNTYSFFKVSLKANNTALAFALQTEKQKHTLLQKDNMHLRKEVASAHFDLAIYKHKCRELLLILKNLYRNSLQQLNMVVELFPDSDLFEPSGDHNVFRTEPDNPPVENLPSLAPDLPEVPKDSEMQAGILENNMPAVLPVPSRAETDKEKRYSNHQALQRKSEHQSNILREEVSRVSHRTSQSAYDIDSLPGHLSGQTSSAINIAGTLGPSAEVNAPCDLPENTVVFNPTMELTHSNDAEIAIHHSTEQKNSKLPKPKCNKIKVSNLVASSLADTSQGMGGTSCGLNEPISTTSDPEGQILDISNKHFQDEFQSKLGSHIPKRVKSRVEREKKVKSTKSTMDSGDSVCLALGDYLMDDDVFSFKPNKKETFPFEKDPFPKTKSKVTYRKPRNKSQTSSLIHSVATVLSPHDQNNGGSIVDHNDGADNFETVQFEGASYPTGGNESQINAESSTKSQGHSNSRCRGTFVISADHTAHIREELGLLSKDKDSSLHIEESLDSRAATKDAGSVTAMPSSCKRPWMSTQDPGSLPGDLYGSNNKENVLPLEEFSVAGHEFQKPKKARKEVSSRCGRKKSQSSNDVVKDMNKHLHGKSVCPAEHVASLAESTDSPDFLFLKDIFLLDEDTNSSKSDSRVDKNPKWYRNKFKLPSVGNTNRNPRKTFFLSNPEMPPINMSKEMTEGEGARQHLGDLLIDEIPPSLNSSIADTGPGSLTCSPKRQPANGQQLMEETTLITPVSSPAGRVLMSVTNNHASPCKENQGRSKRCKDAVSYKEPSLRSKMRR